MRAINMVRKLGLKSAFFICILLPAVSFAFNFDEEMGGGIASPNQSETRVVESQEDFDFDAVMGGKNQNRQEGSNDFLGSVHDGRAQIKENTSLATYAELENRFNETCRCSLTSSECSGEMNLKSYKTEKHINEATDIIGKVDELCISWSQVKDHYFRSTDQRNDFIKQWSIHESTLLAHKDSLSDVLSSDAKQYAYLEQQRQQEIEAERERAKDKGGFQWGKFAALGVGAMAGGLDKLDSETQVDTLGGMVRDSMEGQQGVGNTKSAVNRSVQRAQQRREAERKRQELAQQRQAAYDNKEYREGSARSEQNRRKIMGLENNPQSAHVSTASPKSNGQKASVPKQQASNSTPSPKKKSGPMSRQEVCGFCPPLGAVADIGTKNYISASAVCDQKGFDEDGWLESVQTQICYNNPQENRPLPNGKTVARKTCVWWGCYKSLKGDLK